MSTTNVATPLPAGLSQTTVIAALHNHDLMIRTLCPALISYEFESGDMSTQAMYIVTDKKPIGQVRFLYTIFPPSLFNPGCLNEVFRWVTTTTPIEHYADIDSDDIQTHPN